MKHTFYSVRTGKNKNAEGVDFPEFRVIFLRSFKKIRDQGYFDAYLGWHCVDRGDVPGKVPDVKLEILLKIRKQGLWPIHEKIKAYSEEDSLTSLRSYFKTYRSQ